MDFIISKNKQHALREKMSRLRVREDDIEESFTRSGGRGGQNVNKTSTCVYLKHRPTGTEVKCQLERSQAVNRFLARKQLLDKIEYRVRQKEAQEKHMLEKIRRQKRKRPRAVKERILEGKRIHSQKKKMRSFNPASGKYEM